VATPVGAPPADTDGSPSAGTGLVLGLDIGGTKLAAGVVDASGHVLSFRVTPTEPERGPEDGLARLFELGHAAIADAGGAVDAVGIGSGGPLDPFAGVLVAPPHLTGWRDVPVRARAEEAFGRPVKLENDATAAAAGEHRYGAGIGVRNLVYLTISTGVGGGVVLDGRLYRGAGGNGGELGHVTVDWKGRECRGCGRRGCLEAYVSGTSIAERAQEAGLPYANSAELAAAARDGEPGAVAVWDETIEALGCGITSIVNLFEPDMVVIGGGVARCGEQLLGPARTWVTEHAMGPTGRSVEIVRAALGDHVGVVGAAAIVYDRSDARV
jgi:glucokinase